MNLICLKVMEGMAYREDLEGRLLDGALDALLHFEDVLLDALLLLRSLLERGGTGHGFALQGWLVALGRRGSSGCIVHCVLLYLSINFYLDFLSRFSL